MKVHMMQRFLRRLFISSKKGEEGLNPLGLAFQKHTIAITEGYQSNYPTGALPVEQVLVYFTEKCSCFAVIL